MNIAWSDLKEIFFAIGSVAGVFALTRPLIESKYQRDITRVDRIKSLIKEQALVDLEYYVYQSRRIPGDSFKAFDQLAHEVRTNQDGVRFTSMLATHLKKELDSLLLAYARLRDFVQVNEWEPRSSESDDGEQVVNWLFNRAAFEDSGGIAQGYSEHLDKATEQAVEMRKAFQRLQLVSEIHLFETPFATYLLKRRFQTNAL
jgi:hypothetical protein